MSGSRTPMCALLEDPNGHLIRLEMMSHSEGPPIGWSSCQATYQDRPGPDTGAGLTDLEFHDGRLIGAWDSPPEGPGSKATATLEDGSNFTQRWNRPPLAPDTVFALECTRTDLRTIPWTGPEPRVDPVLNVLQGIFLQPLAAAERAGGPRSERAAALKGGPVALASLSPGARIGDARAFAAAHPFVSVRPGPDPNYTLLEVDLGALRSPNLTYFHDSGRVGVRNGQVVWRMQPGLDSGWGLARERELPPSFVWRPRAPAHRL